MTQEETYKHYKRAMQFMKFMMNNTSGAVDKNSKPKKKPPTHNRFNKAKITQLLHKKK